MGEARQTRRSDIAMLLEAAGLKVSESRVESLAEEHLALAASAKGIADVVTSWPQSVPAVVFQSLSPDQGGHR